MDSKCNKVVLTRIQILKLEQHSEPTHVLKGLVEPGLCSDHPQILHIQTGYVAANEGILSLCLLDSSQDLLSSLISCHVTWRQRSNRGQSDPPRSRLLWGEWENPHCSLALTLSLSTSSSHNPPPQASPLKVKLIKLFVFNESVHPALLISDWLGNHLYTRNLILSLMNTVSLPQI